MTSLLAGLLRRLLARAVRALPAPRRAAQASLLVLVALALGASTSAPRRGRDGARAGGDRHRS